MLNHNYSLAKYLVALSICSFLFVLTACVSSSESSARASDNAAIRGLLVSKAEEVSAATSALESIDRGEIDVARSTLEAQVSSGLTVLYALRADARKEDAQLITDAIQEAEGYVKRKNLTVVRPDGALSR